jgi:hypothetical protein
LTTTLHTEIEKAITKAIWHTLATREIDVLLVKDTIVDHLAPVLAGQEKAAVAAALRDAARKCAVMAETQSRHGEPALAEQARQCASAILALISPDAQIKREGT